MVVTSISGFGVTLLLGFGFTLMRSIFIFIFKFPEVL
jgi:hypothetical protein